MVPGVRADAQLTVWREEAEDVREFVHARCDKDLQVHTRAFWLWNAYVAWADSPIDVSAFLREINELRDVRVYRPRGDRGPLFVRGLLLAPAVGVTR